MSARPKNFFGRNYRGLTQDKFATPPKNFALAIRDPRDRVRGRIKKVDIEPADSRDRVSDTFHAVTSDRVSTILRSSCYYVSRRDGGWGVYTSGYTGQKSLPGVPKIDLGI